ncbi:MAG: MerR family transcriptional regulator [Rubrobacteraceae bacterium]
MDQTARDGLFRIGEVARLSGFPVKTIRYYEERGLLEPASRNEAGYRLYGDAVLGRLKFIRRAKLLGLTLDEIHGLISIAADCTGEDFFPKLEEVLDSRLRDTRQEISRLSALRDNLLYYRRRLYEADIPQECDQTRQERPGESCGCLETVATVAGETSNLDETTEEVKDMKILEENGRLLAARQGCCDECDCEECATEQCGCC